VVRDELATRKQLKMKILNNYSQVFIILFPFFLIGSLALGGCKSAKNQSIIQYRRGLLAKGKGKLRMAHRRVRKAVILDPGNEKYLMEASILANQIGQPKLAMRYIEKIPCDQADCPTEDRVKLIAWKAIMALDLGERKRASALSNRALLLMDRHRLEDDSLRSTILNNKATAFLFDQGCNGAKGEPCHFKYIHRRDFEYANRLLTKALQLDSANCIARENREVVKSILAISSEYWRYGYLPDSIYPKIPSAPPFCLPESSSKPATINYKGLHKTLEHKRELVLVLDISGSMGMTIGSGNSNHATKPRIELMKEACKYLLTHLDSTVSVGAISIGGSCAKRPMLHYPVGQLTATELNEKIEALPLFGGTPLDERVLMGRALFNYDTQDKAMLLFSDGVGTCNPNIRADVCQLGPLLAEAGIKFYVFSLLLEKRSSGFEYGVYNCITQATGGLLIGVTEEKIEDKTTSIDKTPISVSLTMVDIMNGAMEHFLKEDRQLDSLKTGP